MVPGRQLDGTWVYTLIGSALAMVVLYDIGLYINRRHNTTTQYIATRNIMDTCLAEERKLGMRLSWRWWEYTNIDILGITAGHAAAYMGGDVGTDKSEGERE